LVAKKLASEEEMAKSSTKVFPYQLMVAYEAAKTVPHEIREALQDAMEIATRNVPPLGKAYVAIDTSGSMGSPITGNRMDARGRRAPASSVRCVDVASLFGASVLRTNRDAELIPFAEGVKPAVFNPRDTIATNAGKLAAMWGGGTNCSAVLQKLNAEHRKGDCVIYVSDYESWVDSNRNAAWSRYYGVAGEGTGMMAEWQKFKRRNPNAKLICIDLTPYTTTQVKEHEDILQVGGFSDQVFNVVAAFVEGGNSKNYWVDLIDSIDL
jgi:60 kDa SS-A/Ro ribonucleoprotein